MTQHSTSPSKKISNNTLFKHMFTSAYKLGLFMFVCIILLLATDHLTAPKIAYEHRQAMLKTFNQVLSPDLYNNIPLEDTLTLSDPKQFTQLGSEHPVTLYRARKDNQPAGLIFQIEARNGYSGHISLLMAVLPNGKISGVRVLEHRETPGLGDKIELQKSDWILSFNGQTIQAHQPNDPRWAVKKDGGDFDQFTGATITPRAVVGAVKKALLFIQQRGESLYE